MVADCGPMVPAITVSATTLDAVVRGGDLLVDQRLDVLVVDVLLAVGERLEADEGVLEGVVAELVAELLQLRRGRRGGRNACPSPARSSTRPTISGVMIS